MSMLINNMVGMNITASTWNHLAIVYTHSTNSAVLYINGTDVSTNGDVYGGVPVIGGTIDFLQNCPLGTRIDNIRYSRAAMYTANFTPTRYLSADSNTIFYFPLNEGHGATAHSTVNGYVGYLNDTTWN